MKFLKTYQLFESSDYSQWRDICDEDVYDVLDVIKTMSLNIIDKGDFTISHDLSTPMIRKSDELYTYTRTIQFQVDSEKDEAFSYKEISDEVRDIIEYLKSDNWHICYVSYLDERMNRRQTSTSWDGSITNVDLFLSFLEDTRVISVYFSFKKEFRKVVKIQD